MRFLALAVVAMVWMSCKSTSSGRREMRAAAYAVPTFDEDVENKEGDDSAYLKPIDCDPIGVNAKECDQHVLSAKTFSMPADSQLDLR